MEKSLGFKSAFNLITRMVAKCELPALGQSRLKSDVRITSAFPLIATESRTSHHAGDGPEATVAVIRSVELIVQPDPRCAILYARGHGGRRLCAILFYLLQSRSC